MATLYNTGHVTVSNGATKVYGADTAWLAAEIKPKDLIDLGGRYYEIAEVVSSTEITLTYAYSGENITNGDYSIMRIAIQVIMAELYEEVSALIEKYKKREAEMAETIKECQKYIALWKKTGLFMDADGDIAQDEVSQTPTVIIDGEPATLSTTEDIRELTDELNIGQ